MLIDKHELARAAGLKSYDVALPQVWLDNVADKLARVTGQPRCDVYDALRRGTVWCYDTHFLGEPHVFDPDLSAAVAEVIY